MNSPRPFILASSCGAALGVALCACWYYFATHVTRVSITNTSGEALAGVTLHAGGESYYMGGIPAGGSASARITPPVESGLEIEFTAADGTRRRVNAGGYFGPNVVADVSVEVDGKDVVSMDIRYW